MVMKDFVTLMVPLPLTGAFPFHCEACGRCCLHVKESIPLEGPDIFRLAQFLRKGGERIRSTADVLARYAEVTFLSPSGYAMYVLKTTGREDACVFLKDNRCMVHPVKPKACRTYPVAAVPDGHGGYMAHLSMDRPYHFKGPGVSVKRWIKQYCKKEEYDFWVIDFGSAVAIERLLDRIPEAEKDRAIDIFLRFKYLDYDLDKPFLPQFKENNQKLMEALQAMAPETAPDIRLEKDLIVGKSHRKGDH